MERAGISYPLVYLRVTDRRLNKIVESPDMSRMLPERLFPVEPGRDTRAPANRFDSPSGREFLLMSASAPGDAKEENRYVIHAGIDVTNEGNLLRDSQYLLWTVLAASGLISFAIGYRVTRKEIRPLLEIVETTRQIHSSTLSERVRLAGLPTELACLAENFNEMLQRLEESFTRLSRFSMCLLSRKQLVSIGR